MASTAHARLLPCIAVVAGCAGGAATPGPEVDSGSRDGPTDGGPDGGHGGGADAAAPSAAPQPLVSTASFYPRAIRLADGTILASVVAPQPGERLGGTILESTDGGASFEVVGRIDSPVADGGLCCATLFALRRPLGDLAAGTLLWSASVGGDAAGEPMSIPVFSSSDRGRTWSRLSTVAVATVPRSEGGLWEPEFSRLDDGTLVCHYSDETDPAHSQKLVERRSRNGVDWEQSRDTVALSAPGARPGMATVRRAPDGAFVMSYEICGGGRGCSGYLRRSADGWDWGDAAAAGLRPQTVSGEHVRHAPTLTWNDAPGLHGRFYLVGQMVHGDDGAVAADSGTVVFANSENGSGPWYKVPAPLPVPDAYDNFCPNYSSTILPLEDGAAALEIASRWDGDVCRSYFARGPLLGTGDATGVKAGVSYELVSAHSGLCLDVNDGSAEAGANLQQWTCNGAAAQRFTLSSNADGSFSIRNDNSDLCIVVTDGSAEPGANVEQQPCDGGGTSWTVENVGIDAYTLVHTGTSACLDVSNGSTDAGANVHQWACNHLAPQRWLLDPE